MKWKLWVLPLVLITTLSGIYFLPQSGVVALSAVSLKLPQAIGEWRVLKTAPTQEELKALASDTEFSKANCIAPKTDALGNYSRDSYARIDLSIVLSGSDVNNSIHRPERCLPAQGHEIAAARSVTFEAGGGRSITAKRLRYMQKVFLQKEDTTGVQLECITYYFFIGSEQITNDHLERTIIDIKDRLFRGVDQRWAYVSATTWFGKNVPGSSQEVSEEDAERNMQKFLGSLATSQINWNQLKH